MAKTRDENIRDAKLLWDNRQTSKRDLRRREFHLTPGQLEKLLDACKPVPYMVVGGVPPRSPQENANSAWKALGKELGFKHLTVRPVAGKGMEFFTAEVI